MHILTTSTDAQTLQIVPRSDASSPTFELTDKSKNTTSTISVSKTASTPFMTLSGSFSLVQNRFYSFAVKDGSDVIYKGLIFCTDQTDYNKFDVHKDDYVVEDSYDNEYVIL
jgi:predicted small secreted protein